MNFKDSPLNKKKHFFSIFREGNKRYHCYGQQEKAICFYQKVNLYELHSYFISLEILPRRDKPDYRDLFVREASVVGGVRDKRFFISDVCKFDIIRCKLFYFTCNKK